MPRLEHISAHVASNIVDNVRRALERYVVRSVYGWTDSTVVLPGFANLIDEWSHCDFCFTNFGVILEYLESSITTKKAILRLSSTWSWHVYTIVRDTKYLWRSADLESSNP